MKPFFDLSPVAALIGLVIANADASASLTRPTSALHSSATPNLPLSKNMSAIEKQTWSAIPPELIAPLSRLRIGPTIAEYSFGTISKAVDIVALQQADGSTETGSGPWHMHSLAQEFVLHRAAAAVSSDVLPVYYYFRRHPQYSDKVCFSMKYSPVGDVLRIRSTARQAMHEPLAMTIVYRMARALQDLHANGIYHRDVKPQSFIILPDMSVKLFGFGLSAFDDDRSPKGRRMQRVGSANYVAPEIVSKLTKLTNTSYAAADVYSLGVALVTMITSSNPRYTIRSLSGRVSDKAYAVIKCMLQTDPSKRCTIVEALQYEWFASAKKHITREDSSALAELKAVIDEEKADANAIQEWFVKAMISQKIVPGMMSKL